MKKYFAAGMICALACVSLLAWPLFSRFLSSPTVEDTRKILEEYRENQAATPAPRENGADTTETPYVSPIDFDALRAEASDLYAWLDIPGAEISLPIVQSEDDSYYLNHNIYGKFSSGGAIFSESRYNHNDFSDPVTVIYGHRMNDGSMFGNLQRAYWTTDAFRQNKNITVYTPTEEIRFEVFLAAQFSKEHLMRDHDYSDPEQICQIIEQIRGTRQIGGCFDENAQIDYNKRFLILSTCLKGNRAARCLVIAVEADA